MISILRQHHTAMRRPLCRGHSVDLSVADAGHLPHLERPEVVEPALLAFLASP
jgi:pimeloyl-ACP methyl ester carboxylesterase